MCFCRECQKLNIKTITVEFRLKQILFLNVVTIILDSQGSGGSSRVVVVVTMMMMVIMEVVVVNREAAWTKPG